MKPSPAKIAAVAAAAVAAATAAAAAAAAPAAAATAAVAAATAVAAVVVVASASKRFRQQLSAKRRGRTFVRPLFFFAREQLNGLRGPRVLAGGWLAAPLAGRFFFVQ